MKNSMYLIITIVLCAITIIWILMENVFELQKYKIENNKKSLKSNLENLNIHLDLHKLMNNSTYTICRDNKINALISNAKNLIENKIMSNKLEKEYNNLVSLKKLHCGLSINYKFHWDQLNFKREKSLNQKCNGFIESNYQLLKFMGKICDKYKQIPKNIQYKAPEIRKGVIYTGTEKHFKNIYLSILSHRLIVNSKLPIEIWINYYEFNLCKYIFENIDGVSCKVFPEVVYSFRSKFYALLYTEFTDVLYMDSDTVILSDINVIFNSIEYKKTGYILWPDIHGLECYDSKNQYNSQTRGYTAFPIHILYKHGIGGLSYENSFSYNQEAETGQLVINLNRHKGLIQLCLYYSEIPYLYALGNGDKDIFRLIFLMMGEPFKFMEYLPDVSATYADKEVKRANFIHYWHHHEWKYNYSNFSVGDIIPNKNEHSLNRTPFFIHQLKYKDSSALKNIYKLSGSSCYTSFSMTNINNKKWIKIVLPHENHYEKLVNELYIIADTNFRSLTQFSIDRPLRYVRYCYINSISFIGWFIGNWLH